MSFAQILGLGAAALFWGLVLRNRGRVYFLLIASTGMIFWLQPALPLRGFSFWLPLLTLTLTVVSWLVTSPPERRADRENLVTGAIILSLVGLLAATRYLPFEPGLLPANPPSILPVAEALILALIACALIVVLKRFDALLVWAVMLVLIGVFLILKVPQLSLWTGLAIRNVTGQGLDAARVTDLRWLGFSYLAFRLIHTLRDRQTGRLPAVNLAEYVVYAIFFPAVAAGPIDRLERFIQDLRRPLALTDDDLLFSGRRLVVGLFKKFVVADSLALIALNDVNALQVRTGGWMWVLLYAFAFQIYFDFSGYTDIAIGIGSLLGIRLPENFSSPYLKPDLTQFWNNWHMTLTQWFRSYFFNPLTRWMRSWKKPLPVPVMILAAQLGTMLLIGFWHGVTWNFTLWGLWHGLGLFLHNRWNDWTRGPVAAWAATPFRQGAVNLVGTLLTFHFVVLGWVFFALSLPSTSLEVFLKLFGVR